MLLRLALALLCGVSIPIASALERGDLEQRAAAGDTDAIHILCYAQLYGEGLRRSPRRAFRWCKRGAELGLPSSQTLLGEMYRFGYHVRQSDDEARRWYEAAAKQNHVHAQFMLGRLIFQHAETTDGALEACYWLVKAADAGYPKAKDQLFDLDESWSQHFNGNPPREHFCDRQ